MKEDKITRDKSLIDMYDRGYKVSEMMEVFAISKTRIHQILHKELDRRSKESGKLVRWEHRPRPKRNIKLSILRKYRGYI